MQWEQVCRFPRSSRPFPKWGEAEGAGNFAEEMVGEPKGKMLGHCQAAWVPLNTQEH